MSKKHYSRHWRFEETREKYIYKSHDLVPLHEAVALLLGEMQTTWDGSTMQSQSNSRKKKQKQVKALTVRQARQSFHRGSICEDGLVEYGGHV